MQQTLSGFSKASKPPMIVLMVVLVVLVVLVVPVSFDTLPGTAIPNRFLF
ncbi:TPA: hypothetical protein HA351_13100 [Methanosarcinaceae archaeon]|nr:hypothetical protein [Methanosarcinaceae archaeon]